ncbi:MAG: sigma factor-like helix-turn-helix DNA-binding protein, partial [Patescibacteria group bacterium]
ILDTSLEKLGSLYREPLVLYYYEDKDYKEISDIMHLPIATVSSRLRRGKMMLKKLVEENK